MSFLLLLGTFHSPASAQKVPDLAWVPAKAAKGPSEVSFASRVGGFDAPYLSSVNSTVLEWWWFEAVAWDLKTSLTVIFFTTSGQAFPLSGNTNNQVTTVFVSGLLPNGTVFYSSLLATGAILASGGPFGESLAADFVGAGAKFTGSADLSRYLIELDAGEISGNLLLTSTVPAHYTCSANLKKKQDLQVFPQIGWSNAQPAAAISGQVTVGDQILRFDDGLGYHDHNWADAPFTSLIQSWYWGHAELGPFNIVWFDGIGSDGEEHVSAYLARDGKVLLSSCTSGSVKVRPVGRNATFPPHPGPQHTFSYWNVTMRLDDGQIFRAKVTPRSKNIRAPPLYTRWLGEITGGLSGGKQYTGISAFEQFTVY